MDLIPWKAVVVIVVSKGAATSTERSTTIGEMMIGLKVTVSIGCFFDVIEYIIEHAVAVIVIIVVALVVTMIQYERKSDDCCWE